jgi:sterol desaturase/sphingolipid hydroxylase (fatty acid hydroxylase superfamily)
LEEWHKQLSVFPEKSILMVKQLALVMLIFLPLERLFPVRPQRLFRKGFMVDMLLSFINSILPGLILVVPLAAMVAVFHRFLPTAYLAWVSALPYWEKALAAFIIGDIGAYWGHRWSHEIPLLWRFHAVHHRAEEMDWLVNSRAHPLDMAFTKFCSIAPVFLLGLVQVGGPKADPTPLLLAVLIGLWGYFIHANIRWRFGWLEYLIATPAFHHWHHTNDGPDKINKNYSASLPWVDRAFGTFYLPRDRHPEKYGVTEVRR